MKFKYKNDIIEVNLRLWLLGALLRNFTEPFFHSTNLEYSFYSFSEYWREVGKRSALVQFITSKVPGKYGPKYYTLPEIIQRIARLDLGENPGIIIYNVDLSKTDRLLHMFAGVSPHVFTRSEIIVFPAQNKEAAYKLCQAIPSSIADVSAFADGYIYCSNEHT